MSGSSASVVLLLLHRNPNSLKKNFSRKTKKGVREGCRKKRESQNWGRPLEKLRWRSELTFPINAHLKIFDERVGCLGEAVSTIIAFCIISLGLYLTFALKI